MTAPAIARRRREKSATRPAAYASSPAVTASTTALRSADSCASADPVAQADQVHPGGQGQDRSPGRPVAGGDGFHLHASESHCHRAVPAQERRDGLLTQPTAER